MEKNSESYKLMEQARTLLILNNFDWIKQRALEIGVEIIPLKGIDLLQTIYSENLDRHLNDIDFLCQSIDDCIKLVNYLCQEGYRVEFPFATRPEVLASKKKISLLSCSTVRVNVDIHIAFVTKKFFSKTVGTFNTDALSRCSNGQMNEYDRWIFLAQHASFHLFADFKWTKDLRIIYDGYSGEQVIKLINEAEYYGFKRVVIATLCHIYKDDLATLKRNYSLIKMSSSDIRFLGLVLEYDRPITRQFLDKITSAYWEFMFIDNRVKRINAWFSLFFPSVGMLTNIYRIKNTKSALFFYPLNLLVSGFTSLLFALIYVRACAKRINEAREMQ